MKKLFTLIAVFSYIANGYAQQGLWTPHPNYPAFSNPTTFTLESKAYLYTGATTSNFYAYDPVTSTWSLKADYPGGSVTGAAAFATDSFGYVGAGITGTGHFYQYNPDSNSWRPIARLQDSTSIYSSFAFGIGNKGYVVGGAQGGIGNGQDRAEAYSYDRSTNTWSRIDSLPKAMSAGFTAVVNGNAYCGYGSSIDSIYAYNPGTSTWSRVNPDTFSNVPSQGSTTNISCFVINNKIYVFDATAYSNRSGFRIYDVITNTWSLTDVFPYPWMQCTPARTSFGFGLNNTGYILGGGCSNTTLWQYDTAHYFNLSSFSPDTICQADSFTVSFTSDVAFNSGNNFAVVVATVTSNQSFTSTAVAGQTPGTYTFTLPYSVAYSSNINTAGISVTSSSPAAQTHYSPGFVIKKGPSAAALFDYNSCGGSALLIYRYTPTLGTSVWTSNPAGLNDTATSISFTPTQTTTIYNRTVYAATGCVVNDSTVVTLFNHPNLNISDSSFHICNGSSATLGGTSTTNCSYAWTGGSLNSNSVNPVVSPTNNVTYHLTIKDTVQGCSTSGNTVVTVSQPLAQTLCFVTVDSTSTYNIVVWEKLSRDATDSFYIFRETSTNIYTQIAAVPADSLSAYNDYAANPNITGYRYKISAKDTCLNTGALSPYHNTIHLQYLGSGNLIWNVYEIEGEAITPVNSFDVYIDSLSNGNWSILVNVPGNQYTTTDINFNQHPTARYRIVANWAYSCVPTRSASSMVLSNIIRLNPNGIIGVDAAESITLYPNPTRGELIINCGSGTQVDEVNIFSIDGRLISTIIKPANNRLNVSPMAEGVYIAEITVRGIAQRFKWVKM